MFGPFIKQKPLQGISGLGGGVINFIMEIENISVMLKYISIFY